MVKTLLRNALNPLRWHPPFTSLKAGKRWTRQYASSQRRHAHSPPLCRLDTSDKDLTAVVLPTAVAMTAAVLIMKAIASQALSIDTIDEISWEGQLGGLTIGDYTGAAIWAVALYFVSPLQLLLLFLGRIETERPSDWLLNILGRVTGQDVEAIDYTVPVELRAGAVAFFIASGIATAATLGLLLGDATWSVSTGIGALFAAGFYEIGRPERLTVAQSKVLEAQWQDFASFADEALERRGRSHETEIINAFRRRFGKYRTQSSISDARVRDMIRNWHPGADRSRTGWYRNVSLLSLERRAVKVVATENTDNDM